MQSLFGRQKGGVPENDTIWKLNFGLLNQSRKSFMQSRFYRWPDKPPCWNTYFDCGVFADVYLIFHHDYPLKYVLCIKGDSRVLFRIKIEVFTRPFSILKRLGLSIKQSRANSAAEILFVCLFVQMWLPISRLNFESGSKVGD